MSNQLINWGIIGPGKIAHTFASDMRLVEGAKVYAVASRTSSPDSFANKYDIARAYVGYDALLADDQVDAVYIATPHSCHLEHAIAALEAGKHVLCEKPVVVNISQAKCLKEVIKQHPGQFFMEAMWSYFLPAIQRLKYWLDNNMIGTVHHVKADFGIPMPYEPDSRLYDPRLGGGSLLDLGIYPVALAWLVYQRLPGKLAVDMHLADTGVDDEILARCDFGSQQALLACSFKQKLANMAIIRGDKGHIEIPDFWRATECRLYQGDDCIESFVDDRKGSGFEFQIGHVNDCIRNGYNQSDQVPFEVSFRFQEFMELIRVQAG